jgi:uncharacterized DUF497 family protein
LVFEWDEHKRRSNLRKHGIDFAECADVFAGSCTTMMDDRFAYGEHRFVTFGLLREVVVVVAHAEVGETVRVISMRKAGRNEQTLYFKIIEN